LQTGDTDSNVLEDLVLRCDADCVDPCVLKALTPFKLFRTAHLMTQCHISEELNHVSGGRS